MEQYAYDSTSRTTFAHPVWYIDCVNSRIPSTIYEDCHSHKQLLYCYEMVAMVTTSGHYGCAIVMSYTEINTAVYGCWSLNCAFLSLHDLNCAIHIHIARTHLKLLIHVCTGACEMAHWSSLIPVCLPRLETNFRGFLYKNREAYESLVFVQGVLCRRVSSL